MKKCKFCNKQIKEEEAYFYIGYWSRNKRNNNVFQYHINCFEQIAGIEYAHKIAKENENK